jgi:hypothetical protein
MNKKKQVIPDFVLLGAAVLAFIAIFDMSYSYYRLLRWTTCGVAIVSAVQLYRLSKISWVWALGILAVIFNPLTPLHFERDTWKVFDGAAGCLFIAVFLITRKHNEESNKS